MGSISRKLVLTAVCLMAVLMMGGVASAQNDWLLPQDNNSISLEMQKPRFDDIEGLGFVTSVWYLSGNHSISEKFNLVVEIPISILEWDSSDRPDRDGETMFGNILLGIETPLYRPDVTQEVTGRLGFRLPLASDEKFGAAEVGIITTMYRGYEAFFPESWTVQGGIGYDHVLESGFNYSVNLDGALIMPSEDRMDNELFIDYNLTMMYPVDKLNFGTGFAGRWVSTAEDADFGEASFHQIGFVGQYDFGTLDAGLHVRIPLDDGLSDFLSFVYGFNLTYDMK